MLITHTLWRARSFVACALLAATTLATTFTSTAARAQEDPPGRVGRLADVQGGVSWFDHQQGQWSAAERNLPLTGGDRLSTDRAGRAEVRIGSTTLRLGSATEVEVLRLDDERISLQLHSGSLALRVRTRELADEIDLVTAEARLLPLRAGHYRLDRVDDTTQAGSWRGELRIDDPAGFIVSTGQRVEIYRESRSRALRTSWGTPPDDAFAEWAIRDDQRDERSAASRYVSPEMTGAEDLDRSGRWEQHPEYGAIWLPLQVRIGWAPYRYGRWAWVQPWGWTWVDEAPWGFAPFHYGRWVGWHGGWGWVPGAYVARPVYAPALVAWVGGGHFGASVQIGGPAIGWLPLAPREVYVPVYRSTPGYADRVNPAPPYRWNHPPGRGSSGPVTYGNQGVPNAVTIVPREILLQRQPVGRAAMEGRDPRGGAQGNNAASLPLSAPLSALAPPVLAPAQVTGPQRPGRPVDQPRWNSPRDERSPGPRDERQQGQAAPQPALTQPAPQFERGGMLPAPPGRRFEPLPGVNAAPAAPAANAAPGPVPAVDLRRERPAAPAPGQTPCQGRRETPRELQRETQTQPQMPQPIPQPMPQQVLRQVPANAAVLPARAAPVAPPPAAQVGPQAPLQRQSPPAAAAPPLPAAVAAPVPAPKPAASDKPRERERERDGERRRPPEAQTGPRDKERERENQR